MTEKIIYKKDIEEWFQYDDYGQIEYSGYYIHREGREVEGEREREGEWLDYSGGNLRVKRNYKDGKEEGEWLWYDINGQLRQTQIFKDGKLIETIKH